MRLTLAVLLYIFMAFSAFGKGNLSTLIADKGLSHALRDLQAIPKPSANEHFAIAGLIFLHSIEKSMQQAYDMGLDLENTDLPILALPIPRNPDPSNFSPDIIDNIFSGSRQIWIKRGTILSSSIPQIPFQCRLILLISGLISTKMASAATRKRFYRCLSGLWVGTPPRD